MISIELRHAAPPEITMHFLLLYKIEVTDRYPVTTAICGACLAYGVMFLSKSAGWI